MIVNLKFVNLKIVNLRIVNLMIKMIGMNLRFDFVSSFVNLFVSVVSLYVLVVARYQSSREEMVVKMYKMTCLAMNILTNGNVWSVLSFQTLHTHHRSRVLRGRADPTCALQVHEPLGPRNHNSPSN